jgi:hypothetical protein
MLKAVGRTQYAAADAVEEETPHQIWQDRALDLLKVIKNIYI